MSIHTADKGPALFPGSSLIWLMYLASVAWCPAAFAEVPATRPTTAPTTKPATAPAVGFAGEWETSFGLMKLTQTGDAVEGTYSFNNTDSGIRGKVAGNTFTFTYTEPTVTGEGSFELGADGNSFTGRWRPKGSTAWGIWQGRRTAGAAAVANNFNGLWQTTYGRMRLRQEGNEVRGTYSWGNGSNISGKVDGRKLTFSYDQPDGEKGQGTYELAENNQGFAGTWKTEKGQGGKWQGTRIKPEPGKIWLVVLESPWEHDLADNEYSFGLMLRTFFARVPRVQVRHKFIHDEADLRRWCSELPYLAEPVVLHISSHGTRQGIQVGGKTIGGKVLAECLKDAGDIRLLHFGTCLVCGGDIPKQIQQARGPGAFPISGYANTADWGGSAVVDFTYLDLIFSRGMSPAEAAKQTRKMLTFANEKDTPGTAISGAGLIFIDPPAATAKAP